MVSNKELLAKKLQQNSQKHQQAQRELIQDLKELKRSVLISDINPSPYQPRKLFDDNEIQQLAESIESIGLLQPISVRRVKDSYQLIAGERRLRAHQKLNKQTIEVIVIDASDEDAALFTLAENLKREDLNDYEIYVGLSALHDDLKKNKQKLAKSLGMIREDMYKYLSYEKMPIEILQELDRQPALMSRTAATAVKKFLSDHDAQAENAKKALLTAWEKLLKNEVEQTKLAALAEKILVAKVNKQPVKNSIVHKIEHDGKVAGNIKFDHKMLKVSLKIENLAEDKIQQLEDFLRILLIEASEKV